jgi:hypothetical protein
MLLKSRLPQEKLPKRSGWYQDLEAVGTKDHRQAQRLWMKLESGDKHTRQEHGLIAR